MPNLSRTLSSTSITPSHHTLDPSSADVSPTATSSSQHQAGLPDRAEGGTAVPSVKVASKTAANQALKRPVHLGTVILKSTLPNLVTNASKAFVGASLGLIAGGAASIPVGSITVLAWQPFIGFTDVAIDQWFLSSAPLFKNTVRATTLAGGMFGGVAGVALPWQDVTENLQTAAGTIAGAYFVILIAVLAAIPANAVSYGVSTTFGETIPYLKNIAQASSMVGLLVAIANSLDS